MSRPPSVKVKKWIPVTHSFKHYERTIKSAGFTARCTNCAQPSGTRHKVISHFDILGNVEQTDFCLHCGHHEKLKPHNDECKCGICYVSRDLKERAKCALTLYPKIIKNKDVTVREAAQWKSFFDGKDDLPILIHSLMMKAENEDGDAKENSPFIPPPTI